MHIHQRPAARGARCSRDSTFTAFATVGRRRSRLATQWENAVLKSRSLTPLRVANGNLSPESRAAFHAIDLHFHGDEHEMQRFEERIGRVAHRGTNRHPNWSDPTRPDADATELLGKTRMDPNRHAPFTDWGARDPRAPGARSMSARTCYSPTAESPPLMTITRPILSLTLSILVMWGCSAHRSFAASVTPPTFGELVHEAEAIVTGTVTDIRSDWGPRGTAGPIYTHVTVRVDSALKGPPTPTRTLRFLGGSVGDTTLAVPGVPTFAVGDRAVFFIAPEKDSVSPLVGLMHGRFRVQHAADGNDYVALFDGRVFETTRQIGSSAVTVSPRPLTPMRLADFEREIRSEARRRN